MAADRWRGRNDPAVRAMRRRMLIRRQMRAADSAEDRHVPFAIYEWRPGVVVLARWSGILPWWPARVLCHHDDTARIEVLLLGHTDERGATVRLSMKNIKPFDEAECARVLRESVYFSQVCPLSTACVLYVVVRSKRSGRSDAPTTTVRWTKRVCCVGSP